MNTSKNEYTVKIPNKMIESSFENFCDAMSFIQKKRSIFKKEYVVYNLFKNGKKIISYQGKFDHSKHTGKNSSFI